MQDLIQTEWLRIQLHCLMQGICAGWPTPIVHQLEILEGGPLRILTTERPHQLARSTIPPCMIPCFGQVAGELQL